MVLYLSSVPCKVGVSGGKLTIKLSEEEKTIPLGTIEGIVAERSVQFTSQAICALAKNDVVISWISQNKCICQTYPFEKRNIMRIKKQFDMLDNDELLLSLSKINTGAKIESQLGLIGIDPKCCLESIDNARTIYELNGIEGSTAALYFSKVKDMFLKKYGFVKRVKHPPTDPVNSVLSFLYSLLYNETTKTCILYGLEPAVGFCHKLRDSHCSLASDIMESLRCEFCDKIAIDYFNGEPDSDEFVKEGKSVFLSNKVKGELISRFYSKLNDSVSTENGFSNDYKGVIAQIVTSFIRALECEDSSQYIPFRKENVYA